MTGDNDAVSFTANGPHALRHIRRLLAGYDLDEEDDDVSHITVEVHFGDDEDPVQEQSDEPTQAIPDKHPPGSKPRRWDAPGRIHEDTQHHRALYALMDMEDRDGTPADAEDVAEFIAEQYGVNLDSKNISSALGKCYERDLADRERDGYAYSYTLEPAGRLEIQRLGKPDLFTCE